MTNTSEQIKPATEPTTGPRSIRDIVCDLSKPVNPKRLKSRPRRAQYVVAMMMGNGKIQVERYRGQPHSGVIRFLKTYQPANTESLKSA